MKLYPLLSLIAGIMCFSFAFVVLLKGGRHKQNRACFIATVLTGIWTLFPFLTSLPRNENTALCIARFLYIFASFQPAAWFYFMVELTGGKNQKKKIIFLSFVSLTFAVLSLTPLIVKGISRFGPNFSPQAGPLYFLFILFFIIIFSDIFIRLFKTFNSAKGYRKSQFYYVCGAYAVGTVSAALHFFSAYTGQEPISHDIFIILYPLITAYAITKYRFMDIKVLITRTGIFIAVYTLVLGLPFLLTLVYKDKFIQSLGVNWWIGPLTLMALLATSGPFVYIYLQKRAESILLREQRIYQETLRQAASGMTRIHNLNKILTFLVESISHNVGVSHIAIYLSASSSDQLVLKAGNNLKKTQLGSIARDNLLILWLEQNKEPLIYEEIKRKFEESSNQRLKKLAEEMQSLYASVIVPNFLEDKLLGVFVLGEKQLSKMYSMEDLNIFSVLASQAALAIENARLYENIEEQVKKRTRELVEVQKQLVHAEKLATVGTLAGGVAHEINNPLTAILTNVQMLLATDELDKESLEMIEEATKRCKTIVQKLMTFAKKPLETTMVYKINLLEVLQSAISFLKFQIEQENIKTVVTAFEKEYSVKGNHNELEQVITNIVLNAKDAIKKVRKSGVVEISLSQNDDWVTIEVKDEGAGIAKDVLPRIFDPFFTTKEVGKGLGLGLSICQAIIDKHKGKITVQSELNKGSTFTVFLPRIKQTSLVNSET